MCGVFYFTIVEFFPITFRIFVWKVGRSNGRPWPTRLRGLGFFQLLTISIRLREDNVACVCVGTGGMQQNWVVAFFAYSSRFVYDLSANRVVGKSTLLKPVGQHKCLCSTCTAREYYWKKSHMNMTRTCMWLGYCCYFSMCVCFPILHLLCAISEDIATSSTNFRPHLGKDCFQEEIVNFSINGSTSCNNFI